MEDLSSQHSAESYIPKKSKQKFKYWKMKNSSGQCPELGREEQSHSVVRARVFVSDAEVKREEVVHRLNNTQEIVGPDAVVDTLQLEDKFTTKPPDGGGRQDSAPAPAPTYNTRFLSEDADTYEVDNFDKNVMLIFNQYDVHGYKKRDGTFEDVKRIKETFGKYKFNEDNIFVHQDLKYNDLMATLNEFSGSDFTDFGCIVVVVLTHGEENGYLRAQDRSYHESELINAFFDKDNQTLATKPKVFIVQACRGRAVSQATVAGEPRQNAAKAPRRTQVYTLPEEADVLLLHSTYAGVVSHCEKKHGSWFVQTLCDNVSRLADSMHLEEIMVRVKRDVAINKTRAVRNQATGRTDLNKQMPAGMSTLTRKLYFKTPTSPKSNEQ